jgi:hypothetical protein
MLRLLVLVVALAAASLAAAQDLARIVTRADVEKVTGQKFKEGVKPMPSQISSRPPEALSTVVADIARREGWRKVIGVTSVPWRALDVDIARVPRRVHASNEMSPGYWPVM